MKKLLLALLLAGAAAVFWCARHGLGPAAGSEYYADYLPADTVAAVSLHDLQGLSEQFPQSPLGRFLSKPVAREILSGLGAKEEDMQRYDEFCDSAASLLTNPALQEIFGGEAAIALLPPDPARLQEDPVKELRGSLILFGASASAGAIDSAARLTMSKEFSREQVEGLDMTRIRLDGSEEDMFGYAQDGVALLSWSSGRIAAAVQQKKRGGGLRGSPLFAAARTFWAEAAADGRRYAAACLNAPQLRSLLSALKQEKDAQASAAAYLQGIKGISVLAAAAQGSLHLTARTEYNLAALHEAVRRQMRAEKNLSLALLTESTPVYYWSSAWEPQSAARLLAAAGIRPEAADSTVQQELGLPLEQLLAAFGPQMGMTVGGIVNTGLFPLPKAVLFLQVRQADTARQAFDSLRAKIAERGFAQEQTDEVNGQRIHSWSLLPTEATHPALALTGSLLYFANGEGSLRTALAQDQGQLSKAMRTALGPALAGQIAAANSSVCVLRPALLAAQSREAADWIAETFAASKDISAQRLKEELLLLMRSVDTAAAWGSLAEDHALHVLVVKPAEAGQASR